MQQIQLFPNPAISALRRAVESEHGRGLKRGNRTFPGVRASGLKALVQAVEPTADVRRGTSGFECRIKGRLLHPFGRPTPWQGWDFIARYIVRRLPADLEVQVVKR